MGQLRQRQVSFDIDNNRAASWHDTLPEFCAAANAVSLMMPYVEPFVIRAMRDEQGAVEAASPTLGADVRTYVRQEAQHQTQHRRFNASLAPHLRGLGWMERSMAWTYRTLWNRGGSRFRTAFAAASESAAYGVARWVEANHSRLFAGADGQVAALYLWHLAEEVEHKDVAYDVYDLRYQRRGMLGAAMVISVLVLAFYTVWGTVLGLHAQRRLFSPVAWWRLTTWAFGFAFSELPNMFASTLPGHHPSDFVDPTWFELYLLDLEGSDQPVQN